MKLIGVVILISSSTAMGLLLSEQIKKRERICGSMSKLCDDLLLDIGYLRTPMNVLLPKCLASNGISFASYSNVTSKQPIKTALPNEENEKISDFFYSLGRSDASSQISTIKGFKEYSEKLQISYCEAYRTKSRIYVTFGLSFGIILSLMLI